MNDERTQAEIDAAIAYKHFSDVADKIASEVWYEFFSCKGFNNMMENLPAETAEDIKDCLRQRAMTLIQTFTGVVVVPNVRFDFQGMAVFARHTLGLEGLEAVDFINRQYYEFTEKLRSLQENDFIVSAMPDTEAGGAK